MGGVYFDSSFTAFPTCAPSRKSIVSGKYPARLGCWNHGELGGVQEGPGNLPLKEITYAEVFKKAGYVTGHVGKWHCGEDGYMPQDQGYDYVYGANDFCCIGSYYYPFSHPRTNERAKLDNMGDVEKGEHLTKILSEKAADFIWENKDKPFILDYWDYAPHTPIEADRDKVEKYEKLVDPNGRQRNPGYAALVEHYDEAVGTILKAIKDAGIADNTIIIFTSDNGGVATTHDDVEEFSHVPVTSNYPLRDGKHSQYCGGTCVPTFVVWPGVAKAGEVCSDRIISFDIYPTMLKMANIMPDPNQLLDGRDFTKLVKNPKAKLPARAYHWLRYPRIDLYHEGVELAKGPCGSIVKGDWKLLEFPKTLYGQEQSFELYNIADDISEERNLADKMPGKVKELKSEMYAWRKEVGAPIDSIEMYRKGLVDFAKEEAEEAAKLNK